MTTTDRCKAILRAAEQVAAEFHHEHVSDVHLLIAIARDRQGAAANVLKELGIDPDCFELVARRLLGIKS